jgi:hypothetical protein
VRGFVAKGFSWPVAEPVLDQGYLIVGHFFEFAVLGKKLGTASMILL